MRGEHRSRSKSRWFLPAFCSLITVCQNGSASSRELHPGIIGKDDRVRVEDTGPPWNAIGHVNIGGYRRTGQCTGTLIASNVVVTAAHCVVDPWKGAPYPLHNIHFLVGVRGSAHQGHATAKCLRFIPGHKFVAPAKKRPGKVRPSALSKDAVAIILADKLAAEPAPLAADVKAHGGQALVHAAYPADRRFVLSADHRCRLLHAGRTTLLWLNDCDTHPASSGGPLFIEADGVLKLAAIMVATGQGKSNVALPISDWKELVQMRGCQ